MMRKGEEARASRTSFSSKALTKGVLLKGGSAAVIVLLLFFASLPGAKGSRRRLLQALLHVPQRNRYSHLSPPESWACGIPDVDEVTEWGLGGLKGPAAKWFQKSMGLARINKVSASLAEKIPGTRKSKEWMASKDAGEICTEEKAVKEITMKAYTAITANRDEPLTDLYKIVKKMTQKGMDFLHGFLKCLIIDSYYVRLRGACKIEGVQFMRQIPMCEGDQDNLCDKLCKKKILKCGK